MEGLYCLWNCGIFCNIRISLFGSNHCVFCRISHSIREAAANNLKRLAEEFGPERAMQHIIPQVCLFV